MSSQWTVFESDGTPSVGSTEKRTAGHVWLVGKVDLNLRDSIDVAAEKLHGVILSQEGSRLLLKRSNGTVGRAFDVEAGVSTSF